MGSFKRGVLIVIEGVDRSGKSTQCKKLVESLNQNNLKSELITFPDRKTPIGQLISNYLSNTKSELNDKSIHLLFTANRWENSDKITKLLNNGTNLIVDRYSYSGIVYSAIKPNMDMNWCKQPENGLPKPDRVFLLTLNSDTMLERPGFGTERYENVTVQKQATDLYLELSKGEDNWEIIDASFNIETVHQLLLKRVLNVIQQASTTPLKFLNFINKP